MPKHFFLFITAGTLLMIVVMIKTGKPLKTETTPHGIVDLEFAWNSQQANDVIKAWQADGKMEAAKKNTQYDFNFILFYTLFFTFGCRIVAKRSKGLIQKMGMILSGCAIAAGLLDVMENFGMLQTLHGHVNDTITLFTVICSGIKWILALTALLYFVIFGLISLRKKAVT